MPSSQPLPLPPPFSTASPYIFTAVAICTSVAAICSMVPACTSPKARRFPVSLLHIYCPASILLTEVALLLSLPYGFRAADMPPALCTAQAVGLLVAGQAALCYLFLYLLSAYLVIVHAYKYAHLARRMGCAHLTILLHVVAAEVALPLLVHYLDRSTSGGSKGGAGGSGSGSGNGNGNGSNRGNGTSHHWSGSSHGHGHGTSHHWQPGTGPGNGNGTGPGNGNGTGNGAGGRGGGNTPGTPGTPGTPAVAPLGPYGPSGPFCSMTQPVVLLVSFYGVPFALSFAMLFCASAVVFRIRSVISQTRSVVALGKSQVQHTMYVKIAAISMVYAFCTIGAAVFRLFNVRLDQG